MCLDGIEPPELRIELQPPAGQQSQSRAAALSRDTHRAHTALKAHDYNAAIKRTTSMKTRVLIISAAGVLLQGEIKLHVKEAEQMHSWFMHYNTEASHTSDCS